MVGLFAVEIQSIPAPQMGKCARIQRQSFAVGFRIIIIFLWAKLVRWESCAVLVQARIRVVVMVIWRSILPVKLLVMGKRTCVRQISNTFLANKLFSYTAIDNLVYNITSGEKNQNF
jgi:hypothetical protein